MEIGVHQVGSPEDLAFEGVVAVCQAIDLELDPGDPPTPRGELAGRWFAPAPDRRMHVWLATIDGTAVGAAGSQQELDGATDAGAAFCAALGMTHRSDDRCSRLRVADVDARQQQRWIDDGAVSAPGYR